jgi:lipooligosaccharide transport system permease protein
MAITTYIRSWQDFDLIALAQTGMILFSGTFFPVSLYPSPLKDVVYALPLYHAVELVRTAALGQASGALAGHTGYLLLMFIAGLYVTCRQMDRHLRE